MIFKKTKQREKPSAVFHNNHNEIISRHPSATCCILQNDELRDNLDFVQNKFTYSYQVAQLNRTNLSDKILSYQDLDPLPIRGFNSCDSVPIWNKDSQILSFISKWCIRDSSNVTDYSQMYSSRKHLEYAQEQNRNARMKSKESGFCDSKVECQSNPNCNKDNEVSSSSISFECQSEENNDAKDPEYHVRKDVIIKNIFRAFRRFYAVQFKSFYDFTKKKVSKYRPSEQEIIEQVRKYVSNTFGTPNNKTSVALIVAILDPTGKYTKQKGIYELMGQNASRLLFKFNKRVLHELFQIPEFIAVLLHFLDNIDIKRIIPRFRDDEKTFEIYSKQVEKIREVSMDKRMYSSK